MEVSLENQQIGFVVVVIVCFTLDKQIKDRLSTLIRRGWNWVWWCMPLLTALGKQRQQILASSKWSTFPSWWGDLLLEGKNSGLCGQQVGNL